MEREMIQAQIEDWTQRIHSVLRQGHSMHHQSIRRYIAIIRSLNRQLQTLQG